MVVTNGPTWNNHLGVDNLSGLVSIDGMKHTNVFGTQEQQDAAWAKAWKQTYKSAPPTEAARNNKAQDKRDIEWARKYQAMTYAAQYGR